MWNMKKLNPMHRMVMRMVMQGTPQVEIAAKMGVTKEHVCQVCNDPTFQEALKGLQDELDEMVLKGTAEAVVQDPVRRVFLEAREKAANTVVGLMDAKSDTIKQKSAFDILDRLGYKTREETKTDLTINIGKKAETTLDETLKEMGVDMSPEEFVIKAVEAHQDGNTEPKQG